ncbi:polyamine acetyltransferase [Metarhizium album ARSEF 1941]|uniref:Polyamine acetyltransferase n=1 Tax=Metarhizium album (strain ARSEF 1941) TaxID=1081103 RepID=A0A0B2WVR7_METAS|nr:polyamine acetyltransferase [Metarhizium album ARSEF 1941]KHN98153.1 polyamine acetyltransferase [Metarhizium album ARSEF 1941]
MDQNPTQRSNDDEPKTNNEARTNISESEFESGARPAIPEDCAIGDSDEDDEEMVETQRTMTQSRMLRQKSPGELRRKVIPFHWAPMLSPLSPADIDACETLENVAVPNRPHASSREEVLTDSILAFQRTLLFLFSIFNMAQIEYRIRKCGSICVGLFNTYRPRDAEDWWIQTMPHARPVETGRQDGSKQVMFAHFIATLGKHSVVTDNDVQFPPTWRDSAASQNSPLGHQTSGRTICLHSFSVCPEVQGIGIGKAAMKAYIQMMNESGVADRIALVCSKSLVAFFAGVGFQKAGDSQLSAAGPDLYNMVFELPGPKALFSLDQSQNRAKA